MIFEKVRIETELSHIDSNRVIVKVSIWSDSSLLGSTLGEGSTVNIAESNAINKLYSRIDIKNQLKSEGDTLNQVESDSSSFSNKTQNNNNKSDNIKLDKEFTFKVNSNSYIESNKNPDDWSKDLSIIDLEIKRLGWNRDQENLLLSRLLNVVNRNKITDYNDLRIFQYFLKKCESGKYPNELNIDRETLIEKTNVLLKKLEWDNVNGREYLLNKFDKNSRQDLTNKELLQFIIDLEEYILNKKNYITKNNS